MKAERIAVCLFVRNEGRDIAEWVVYHSMIGFDAFVIYNNGSDDQTAEVLDRLRRVYDIKVIDWPRATKYSQLESYDDCIKNFRNDFDWIAFIDSDEFIAPVKDNCMKKFLGRHLITNAIALNWAIFGSSSHVDRPHGLIIEEFRLRGYNDSAVNYHTKMIVRPKSVVQVYDPHYISVDEGRMTKADGSPFTRGAIGRSADLAGFDICRVNHYFVRSRAHWAAKMARGYHEGHRSADLFTSHDLNDVEDNWAVEKAPAIRRTLDEINLLPLRSNRKSINIASSNAEKSSQAWIAIPCDLDDVLHLAPSYAAEPGNTLFDPTYYLETYPDIKASGMDPFAHFSQCGIREGRRPCSWEALIKFLRKEARVDPSDA